MSEEVTSALPSSTDLASGKYTISKPLGAGGFGITYLAQDFNGNAVVVKECFVREIFSRSADQISLAPISNAPTDIDSHWALNQFLSEAKTLNAFSHPNIPHVIEYFEQNNTAYMVMEYINGHTLKQIIESGHVFSYDDVQFIINPLLDALTTLHEKNYLHRDLAPDNIMIRDEDDQPFLIDFGAARQALGIKSKSITAVVKDGYSPPEQYIQSNSSLGPYSDVYAIAAVMYELISGQRPDEASARQDASYNEGCDTLKPLREYPCDGFPDYYIESIDRALSISRTMRPQTVAEWQGYLLGHTTLPSISSNSVVSNSLVFRTADQKNIRKITVGRDKARCDFVVEDQTVSGIHLELIIDQNDEFEIVDLDSTNGTYVKSATDDWERITTKRNLTLDTQLQLGETEIAINDIMSHFSISNELAYQEKGKIKQDSEKHIKLGKNNKSEVGDLDKSNDHEKNSALPDDNHSYARPYVNIIEATVLGVKNIFNFSGRASRSEYWWFLLASYILLFLLIVLFPVSDTLLLLAYLYLSPAVCSAAFRRMHDIGKSGWFFWIPLANIIWLCRKGEDRPNKWG